MVFHVMMVEVMVVIVIVFEVTAIGVIMGKVTVTEIKPAENIVVEVTTPN